LIVSAKAASTLTRSDTSQRMKCASPPLLPTRPRLRDAGRRRGLRRIQGQHGGSAAEQDRGEFGHIGFLHVRDRSLGIALD